MSAVAIPAWTASGVLPPIRSADSLSAERSPYAVSLTDCVLRFSDTRERRAVLDGYLRHRAALHAAGLVTGFQWLDGSFLEHVEQTEGRAPNDLDVVTFYRLPVGTSQAQLAARLGPLARRDEGTRRYRVDGYLVHLGMAPERLARQSAYWYGVWSHRRSGLWKGFVEVDLSPTDDAIAGAMLLTRGASE